MTRTEITPLAAALILAIAACGMGPAADSEERLVGPDGVVDWNRYYTNDETTQIMREFTELFPELTRLQSVGQSYLGAELMLIEVSNRRDRAPEEKPALYLDGGIHAQELTGSSVALYVMAHLLKGYGKDPRITELLDTRTFYIRPKFNPDGSDLVLLEDQWLRSTVRPVDENGDGIADSDPPEDLDGDGLILTMRVPDPDGNMRVSAEDPRIMLPREEGKDGPFYRLIREGVDSNRDGTINSDGIGGIDMNRNFPRNWARSHLQPGAGDFPLSEPETYAAVEFINEHRNITSIVHGHTSGGFVYRLPSAMDPAEFDPNDEALVLHLGEFYTRDTGRPVRPSATHPTERRYGTLIQWGYSDHGIVGWVPEYSPAPQAWVPDYDQDGRVTESDWHRFNDEELDGKYFTDWTPFEHPQLGPVEIGGWQTKFWGQNPPAELLEREIDVQVPWILYLAEQSPMLELGPATVTSLGDDRFDVAFTVSNTGFLPTNLTERGFEGRRTGEGEIVDQVVAPPLAILSVEGGSVEGGNGRQRIPHLAGTSPYSPSVTERTVEVSFTVRREEADATVRIEVQSERGGTVRSEAIPLGEG